VGWDFFGGAWLGLIIDTIVCEGLFQNSEVIFFFWSYYYFNLPQKRIYFLILILMV
jgi:hypothetical protein